MNELCTEIGYVSVNKFGEQTCGDHVDVVTSDEKSVTAVLADGLGSGVKANILSTITSKILSTMLSQNLSVEECVRTVAGTLPVCSVRGVAYSTFSVIRIIDNKYAEIIQYDNPLVILLRNGKHVEFSKESLIIDNKTVYISKLPIYENDVFIAMSDGAVHAGVGTSLNFGWLREDIIKYMEKYYDEGNTAKTVATILLEQCTKLYDNRPGDDTTVCAVKVRAREPMNVLIGPPANPDDVSKMMALFFSKSGKHIVCGGTTSTLVGEHLNKPVLSDLDYLDPDVPPIAKIEGVDLVTEGVITITKVLTYAENYLADNLQYSEWSYKMDGASLIARMLFEEATDISFYVGRAVNPAHQNPNLPISFNIKMRLIDELSECLKKMGKRVKVSYF